MLFNIYLGNHSPYDFLRMQDILEPIAQGLALGGHQVRFDLRKLVPAPGINLLLEFFKDEFTAQLVAFKQVKGDDFRFGIISTEDLADDSVMATLHQPWRKGNFLKVLPLADFVWTLLPNQADLARYRPAESVVFLRYGFAPGLVERPALAPKDLDVLIYGTSNPYRNRLIAALEARGLSVFLTECALPDYLRRDFAGRARLILDARRNEMVRYCSPSRIAYGLHSNTLVVAEDFDASPLGYLYAYTHRAPPGRLVETCAEIIARGGLGAEAAGNQARFKAETSMQANIEAALAPLDGT